MISATDYFNNVNRYADNRSVINVALTLLLCMLFVFSIPVSHADGLFDFQMKLAKKGNAEAQFKVGEMYETGFGVKKDMVQAKTWIDKANGQGHETAGFKLLYWNVEKNGLTKDNKAGIESLKAKAKAGDAQAQYYWGKMNAYGVGMKKNTDEAINWLNKAALVGVLEAEREVSILRDTQQQQLQAKKRTDAKKRADLKAKQAQQKKLQAQKQATEKALSKKKAAAAVAATAAAAAQSKASQQATADKEAAAEKAQKEKQLAQQQAAQKQRQAEQKALAKKRADDEANRKTQFESDPCSGKSARFLSTCR